MIFMSENATNAPKVPRVYEMNISDLQELCGKNAQAGGWHEDRPSNFDTTALRFWQMSKIMLMVSELSEGVEELRNGWHATTTHYNTPEGGQTTVQRWVDGVPKLKPEGLPSELADTVIRVLDFCFTEEIDLQSIIQEKLGFNKTRGHKHGRVA